MGTVLTLEPCLEASKLTGSTVRCILYRVDCLDLFKNSDILRMIPLRDSSFVTEIDSSIIYLLVT